MINSVFSPWSLMTIQMRQKLKISMFSGGGYDFPWALFSFLRFFFLMLVDYELCCGHVCPWLTPHDPRTSVGSLQLFQEQILLVCDPRQKATENQWSLICLFFFCWGDIGGGGLWHGTLSVRLTISENESNCVRLLWCQAFFLVPSKKCPRLRVIILLVIQGL